MANAPKKCPSCGRPNTLGEICPYCRGRSAGRNKLQRSAWMLTGVMALLLVVLFFWANRLDPRTPTASAVGAGADKIGVLEPDGETTPGG